MRSEDGKFKMLATLVLSGWLNMILGVVYLAGNPAPENAKVALSAMVITNTILLVTAILIMKYGGRPSEER